jgi:Cu(I)/Ag(I) efflux system membrane fusion protein
MSAEHPAEPMPEGDERPPPGTRAMAVVRWVLVAAMAVAAGASLLHFSGRSLSGGPAPAPANAVYYCPMHPQVQQDHPGSCPICSMTLVPKGEAKAPLPEAQPAGASVPGLMPIDLSPERVQLIGVRTEPVTRRPVAGGLRTVGVVQASERRLAQITARFGGWVEELLVAETGQKVKRGQVLATIYSPELLQAQEELLSALRWSTAPGPRPGGHGGHADPAETMREDARHRLELLGIAAPEIDALVREGKPRRAIGLRSPFDGYVIGKRVVAGMAVQPGAALFEVADLSTVWVVAEVFEADAARVRVGQRARFTVAAYAGEEMEGKVQFVAPVIEAGARTLRVRIEVRNRVGPAGPRLRPGMYGDVRLALPDSAALTVPAQAVVDTGELTYVFLARPGGRFEPRRVKLGARVDADGDSRFEVREGVQEGDVVVTTANFLIDSESRLQAAIAGQVAAEPAAGAAPAEGQGPDCGTAFDARKYPAKAQACRACELQHRGMGGMEEDCKNAIARPWR